jgi:hypothetical protein
MNRTEFIIMGVVALLISAFPGRGVNEAFIVARPEERNARASRTERLWVAVAGLGCLLYGVIHRF